MSVLRLQRLALHQQELKTSIQCVFLGKIDGRSPMLMNNTPRCFIYTSKTKLKKSQHEDIENNAPIKYSTSGAKVWRSINTFEAPKRIREAPKCEPFMIALSIAVFLIYFTMLREENDIDEKLGMSLYDRIPGMEEKNLRIALEHERKHGGNIVDIEKRLAEIEEAKH